MPNNNSNGSQWYWQIAPNSQLLTLCLQDGVVFTTPFRAKDLIIPSMTFQFSAADAAEYISLREVLCALPFDQEARFSTAVFASIACHYLKPLAAKSWYFLSIAKQINPKIKRHSLVKSVAQEQGIYLVLHAEKNASLVILLSKQQQIDANRCFKRGTVIKVHNDRLMPVSSDIQELKL